MIRSMLRLYLSVALTAAVSIFAIERGVTYLFSDRFTNNFEVQHQADVVMTRSFFGPDSASQAAAVRILERVSTSQFIIHPPEQVAQLSADLQRRLATKGYAYLPRADDYGHDRYIMLDNGAVVAVHARDGPFFWIKVAALVALFLLLLGGVMVWAVPHWRDLEQLARVAARFGGGALDARAKMSRYTTVGPLARHFNDMAGQIEQLIRAQRDIVNAASHELRTPLSRLEFGLVNLRETLIERDASFAVGRIDALCGDVAELEALVAELLTLAMLDQAEHAGNMTVLDVEPFLTEGAGLTPEELAQHGIRLHWDLAPELVRISADAKALRRAFSNLMRNALRYAASAIMVRTEAGAPGRWHLIVEDDGPGIPEAERTRVFEAFYRLDQSRTRSTGGFGLGLAIVHKVVTRHGGAVSIGTSTLGGACFVIDLPVGPLTR